MWRTTPWISSSPESKLVSGPALTRHILDDAMVRWSPSQTAMVAQ